MLLVSRSQGGCVWINLETLEDSQVGGENEALIFGVGNGTASVYLKLFMNKEIAQQIPTKPSGRDLSGQAQGYRLIGRTFKVIVQLWLGSPLPPSQQGWLQAPA